MVLKPGSACTADDITEFCRSRIASYKKPSLIEFVDQLPREPNGKVLKRKLQEERTAHRLSASESLSRESVRCRTVP